MVHVRLVYLRDPLIDVEFHNVSQLFDTSGVRVINVDFEMVLRDFTWAWEDPLSLWVASYCVISLLLPKG